MFKRLVIVLIDSLILKVMLLREKIIKKAYINLNLYYKRTREKDLKWVRKSLKR